jgi:hypothetical protein
VNRPTVCHANDSANLLLSQELLTRFQGWRGHSQEAKRASAGGQRHPRHVKRLGRFSSRVWSPGCPCSRCGACSVPLPGGQPWTPTVTLPQGRNGLHAWRMAVLSPWRERSLCRYVHGACMRRTLLDLTPIISATVCHQRNDVERYSRCMTAQEDDEEENKEASSHAAMMGRRHGEP